MTVRETRFKRWVLREWQCCEFRWQILLAASYPERNSWAPSCPTCGGKSG